MQIIRQLLTGKMKSPGLFHFVVVCRAFNLPRGEPCRAVMIANIKNMLFLFGSFAGLYHLCLHLWIIFFSRSGLKFPPIPTLVVQYLIKTNLFWFLKLSHHPRTAVGTVRVVFRPSSVDIFLALPKFLFLCLVCFSFLADRGLLLIVVAVVLFIYFPVEITQGRSLPPS